MLEYREYQKGDIESIRGKLRYFDALTFQNGTNVILDLVTDSRITGAAITLTENGEPFACGAVIRLWEGVGEAYAWTTPNIENHKKWFCEKSQDFIDAMWDELGLSRLQCTVLAGHDKSVKWLERMGFEQEGLMRCYGRAGEDCIRMARVRS